jgi:hypothetical protein
MREGGGLRAVRLLLPIRSICSGGSRDPRRLEVATPRQPLIEQGSPAPLEAKSLERVLSDDRPTPTAHRHVPRSCLSALDRRPQWGHLPLAAGSASFALPIRTQTGFNLRRAVAFQPLQVRCEAWGWRTHHPTGMRLARASWPHRQSPGSEPARATLDDRPGQRSPPRSGRSGHSCSAARP